MSDFEAVEEEVRWDSEDDWDKLAADEDDDGIGKIVWYTKKINDHIVLKVDTLDANTSVCAASIPVTSKTTGPGWRYKGKG